MKKSAPEGALHAAASDHDDLGGSRERLRRAFLRELPGQVRSAAELWERASTGDAEARAQLGSLLRRLSTQASMLQLEAHAHLLSALADGVPDVKRGEVVPERVAIAVRVALRASEQLSPEGGLARAEQEAAQLRWLIKDADAIASGVFPRRPIE